MNLLCFFWSAAVNLLSFCWSAAVNLVFLLVCSSESCVFLLVCSSESHGILWLCLNVTSIIFICLDEARYLRQLWQGERMGRSVYKEENPWLQTWTRQVLYTWLANRLLNYSLFVSAPLFIHSFILKIYIALLQDTTTQRHSQRHKNPVTDKEGLFLFAVLKVLNDLVLMQVFNKSALSSIIHGTMTCIG